MMRRLRVAVAGGLALAALALAACGTGGSSPPADGGTVHVILKELPWTVVATPAAVPAGSVTFNASNEGTLPHDFVVVRSDLAADQLPTSAGLVDESRVTILGRLFQLTPGSSQQLTLTLASGRYVLICNVTGHYNLGQRAAFTVR